MHVLWWRTRWSSTTAINNCCGNRCQWQTFWMWRHWGCVVWNLNGHGIATYCNTDTEDILYFSPDNWIQWPEILAEMCVNPSNSGNASCIHWGFHDHADAAPARGVFPMSLLHTQKRWLPKRPVMSVWTNPSADLETNSSLLAQHPRKHLSFTLWGPKDQDFQLRPSYAVNWLSFAKKEIG